MMLARLRMPAVAVTIAAAAVVGPLLSFATPAQAAGTHGGSGPTSAHTRARATNNPGFAGYQANVTPGSATTSAAQFKVPKLSCTRTASAITPVAGVNANNFTTFSAAALFVGCLSNGAALYYPTLTINEVSTNYSTTHLSAGDVIKLSTKVTTTGTTVQVTDVTKAITKKLTGPGASASNAYAGDSDALDSSEFELPVPSFGTLTFTHCHIDGTLWLAGTRPHISA